MSASAGARILLDFSLGTSAVETTNRKSNLCDVHSTHPRFHRCGMFGGCLGRARVYVYSLCLQAYLIQSWDHPACLGAIRYVEPIECTARCVYVHTRIYCLQIYCYHVSSVMLISTRERVCMRRDATFDEGPSLDWQWPNKREKQLPSKLICDLPFTVSCMAR